MEAGGGGNPGQGLQTPPRSPPTPWAPLKPEGTRAGGSPICPEVPRRNPEAILTQTGQLHTASRERH